MSSEVFPVFPGIIFGDREPRYSTEINEAPAGTEQRVSLYPSPRWSWKGRGILRQYQAAPSPYQSKSEMDCLLWFHERHKGAGESFLFNDPAESWRSNLFPYSEPLLANFTSKTAGITQGALTDGGLSNGAIYPALAQADSAYEQPTLVVGVAYVLSAFVKMTDLSAPSVGTTITTGDFGIYSDGALHTAAATVTSLGGNLYRVSSPRTATVGGARDCGIIRYVGQSGKGFTVSGYQIEPAATAPLAYVKTSGAAFSAQKRVRFAEDAVPGRRVKHQWFDADFELVSVLGES